MNLNMKKNEMGGDGDSCCNPERAQLSLSSTLQSELLLASFSNAGMQDEIITFPKISHNKSVSLFTRLIPSCDARTTGVWGGPSIDNNN